MKTTIPMPNILSCISRPKFEPIVVHLFKITFFLIDVRVCNSCGKGVSKLWQLSQTSFD